MIDYNDLEEPPPPSGWQPSGQKPAPKKESRVRMPGWTAGKGVAPRTAEPPPPPERKASRASSSAPKTSSSVPKASSSVPRASSSVPMASSSAPRESSSMPRTPPPAVWLVVAAVALVAIQAWTMYRLSVVRTDLVEARANLDEARGSLDLLWTTTTRLDEDQVARQSLLQDSIRSVFRFAQGEIALWQTAYEQQQQRMLELDARIASNGASITRVVNTANATNGRVNQLARSGESHTLRLGALEREDQSQRTMLEAVAGRIQSQESRLAGVSASVSSAQQTLAALDAEVGSLEGQIEASAAAQGQLASRFDAVAGWVNAFRQRDMTAPALAGQLGALADGLRRITLRVDSIRARGIPVRGGAGQRY